jgi:PEP-CTERM motif
MKQQFTMMTIIVSAFAFAFCATTAEALSVTVDGNLSDWGVAAPTSNNGNDWTPDVEVDAWFQEDWVGGDGYVGPGNGGQAFDLEAMFLYFDASAGVLYFAMAEGMGPSGAGGLLPGDVFFDFGLNGYDTAVITTGPAAGQVWAGSGDWMLDPDPFLSSAPWTVDQSSANASYTGNDAAFAFNNSSYWSPGNEHWVVELGLTLSAGQVAALSDGVRVHWTQQCGNDVGDLTYESPIVPEPATFLLLGLGIAGTVVRKRFLA